MSFSNRFRAFLSSIPSIFHRVRIRSLKFHQDATSYRWIAVAATHPKIRNRKQSRAPPSPLSSCQCFLVIVCVSLISESRPLTYYDFQRKQAGETTRFSGLKFCDTYIYNILVSVVTLLLWAIVITDVFWSIFMR